MTPKEFFERYGVAILALLTLTIVVLALPGNATRSGVDTGFGTDFDVDSDADPFAAAPVAAEPLPGAAADPAAPGATAPPVSASVATGGTTSGGATGGGATSSGGATPATTAPGAAGPTPTTAPAATSGPAVQFGTGPNCRPDGRQQGISAYNPPCVQWSGTDNGGETFRGVSDDEILIVKYRAQLDPGTEAILAGARLGDPANVVDRAQRMLLRYWNEHAETYDREVVFQNVDASGPSESEEAMRADALRIAQDIKPFAVLEADPAAPIPNILAKELAQRGVICICTTSAASSTYTELPPALFSELPTIDEYAAHAAEYIGKKLEGSPAEYAGDDQTVGQTYNTTQRKYGILYLNGARGTVDPDAIKARNAMVRELNKYGIGGDRISEVGYIYDPGRNQADMTNIIAKFKGEGVTTVIPIWDPLTPIILTQEATRQAYYPEWFNIGIGLSDTTTAGRLYDQAQWQNSFGISPLWVTWDGVEASPGYREFHHGCPECDPGDEGVLINIYRERIETLFHGIHMAGPALSNETFVQGLFNLPPTGGTAGLPLQFWTRQFPAEIKDFTEVWYDIESTGPDERGDQGPGVIWKANNGRRYQIGEWTRDPSAAFVRQNVLQVSNDPPGGTDFPHEADGHTHP